MDDQNTHKLNSTKDPLEAENINDESYIRNEDKIGSHATVGESPCH